MLCNTPGLALGDIFRAGRIEKRRFSWIDGTSLIHHAFLDGTLWRCIKIALGKPAGLVVLALASARSAGTAAVVRRGRIGHLRSGCLAGCSAKLGWPAALVQPGALGN